MDGMEGTRGGKRSSYELSSVFSISLPSNRNLQALHYKIKSVLSPWFHCESNLSSASTLLKHSAHMTVFLSLSYIPLQVVSLSIHMLGMNEPQTLPFPGHHLLDSLSPTESLWVLGIGLTCIMGQ